MSEQDDDLDRLERQLDAAFAATRPRRGFEDELWARLRPRRRRFPRIEAWRPLAGAAAGVAVVLVAGIALATFVTSHRLQGGGGAASTASRPEGTAQGTAGALDGRAAAPLAPSAALPYGPLPAPPGAGVAQVLVDGRMSPLPAGVSTRIAGGALPQPGANISVFRYDAVSGPPSGAVLEPSTLPPGLASAPYPSRQPTEAVGEAIARGATSSATAPGHVTLTQARLVYVAVVSGSQGYLEPAYLFTGTYENGGVTSIVQELVPALAPTALR